MLDSYTMNLVMYGPHLPDVHACLTGTLIGSILETDDILSLLQLFLSELSSIALSFLLPESSWAWIAWFRLSLEIETDFDTQAISISSKFLTKQ